MRNLSKFILLLLCSITVFAQGVCDKTGVEKGGFTFDGPAAVCKGQEIKIKDNSGGTDVKYIYGYQGEDASKLPSISSTTDTKWSFLAAGTYVILQYGKKNGKEMYFCNVATVRESTEPVFTNSACNEYMVIDIPKDPANDFDYYIIEWGDGSSTRITTLPAKQPHNYPSNVPTRTIRVEGFYNTPTSCPRASTKVVSMNGGSNYPTIKTLEMSADSKSAIITFTGAIDEYDLYQRSATGGYVNGQFMKKLKPGTYTVSLMDTVQSCFKVFRNYGCKEGSGEVCTTKLDVKAVDKTNVLRWQNHPSGGTTITYDVQVIVRGVTTTIKREEKGGTNTIIPAPGNPHSDQIDCTKEYCYQVVNKVQGTIDYGRFTYESTSLSPKRCINRQNVIPDAITDALVSVNNANNSDIKFNDNSPWTLNRKRYIIYQDNGTVFVKIDSSATSKQFTDKTADASQKSYCYKVAFVDECGSNSEVSPPFCTTYLSEATNGFLQWTNQSPFGNSVIKTFEIQSFDETTGIASTEANQITTTYESRLEKFEEEAKYRIKAISSDGKESFSNVYTIPVKVKVFVPDAFSPNKDSFNDDLSLKGSFKRFTTFQIEIYNRWGVPVFTSDNVATTWDGNYQNNEAPSDTYSYKIYAKLKDGQEFNKSGKFLLLR